MSETPPNTTFAGCDSTDDGESEGVVDDPYDLVEDPRGHVDHPLAQTNYPTTPETDEMTRQVDETRPKDPADTTDDNARHPVEHTEPPDQPGGVRWRGEGQGEGVGGA